MKSARLLFSLGLLCLSAVGQINSPKIGTVRYQDGSFHTVQGLPDNMIVAGLPLDPAQTASFSDSGGLVVQGGTLRLLAADYSIVAEVAVAEKPLVSIDGDLTSALAWLPQAHVLIHWTGAQFETLELHLSELEGTVTDLQSSGPKQARLIVQHADDSVSGVTVSLRNSNLVSSEPLPGIRGYAFGQSFFVVSASQSELVVDNLRGYRRSVSLPATDLVMERMSNNWFHLYSAKLQQNWALHVTRSDVHLSMLPGMEEHAALGVDSVAREIKR